MILPTTMDKDRNGCFTELTKNPFLSLSAVVNGTLITQSRADHHPHPNAPTHADSGADPHPDVVWITATDGTRVPPFLEDRAAKFLPEKNLLQINGDFRAFTDMEDRWCKQYEHVSGARPTVSDVVHEWFEQALIETVIGVQALHGSQEWRVEHMGRALNEESLTAAVMQRYHVDVAVKRALGAKLGTLRDKSAA